MSTSSRGPLDFFLATDCGIKIELVNDDHFDGSEPTRSPLGREYRIVNSNDDFFDGLDIDKSSDAFLKGKLSPISRVNLSPFVRLTSGIPMEACHFAFIMAPHSLLECFGTYEDILTEVKSIEYLKLPPELQKNNTFTKEARNLIESVSKHGQPESQKLKSNDEGEQLCADAELLRYRRIALASFAIYHGFAYFDKDMNFLQINACSLLQTDFKLSFVGPYKTPNAAVKGLEVMDRIHPSTLELFIEAGVIGFGWVGTSELFSGKPAADGYSCAHGALVFCSDDGTGVTYALPTEHDSQPPSVECRSLLDTFLSILMQSSLKFSYRLIHHQDDIKACKERVRLMLKELSEQITETLTPLETSVISPFPLLHSALKAKTSIQSIQLITDHKVEDFWIRDAHGWYPLHYACRFSAGDDHLFKMLLSKCPPEALLQADRFNRHPLHIACDSNASPNVIKMLLERVDGARDILYEKTRFTGMLPLHIACNSGASIGVIKELLKADRSGESIRDMSITGRLALHMAIDRILPHDVIRLLLEAEQELNLDCNAYRCQKSGRSSYRSSFMKENSTFGNSKLAFSSPEDSIYKWCRGVLPLHMALLQNYDLATIKILANADFEQSSLVAGLVYQPLFEESSVRLEKQRSSQNFTTQRSLFVADESLAESSEVMKELKSNFHRGLPESSEALHGTRALHIALQTHATETVRFLLQKEREDKINRAERKFRAEMRSQGGMTCLHLACKNNEENDIIKMLLDLDPSNVTSTLEDERGFRPLHYVCSHSNASEDVIQMLLSAEKKYYEGKNANMYELSTSRLCNQAKNPLSYATRMGASVEVLDLLLQSEYFSVNGFDDIAKSELATRISQDSRLQKSLVMTLSKRSTFAFLFLEVVLYAVAVVVYFFRSESVFTDNSVDTGGFVILIAVLIMFVFREILQLCSQRSSYFLDGKNYFEVCNLASLLAAIVIMESDQTLKDYNYMDMYVMIAAAVFLVTNLIYFMRSTFLPFSEFAQGLIAIFTSVVPFLVVTVLLLLLFTYTFRAMTMYEYNQSLSAPPSPSSNNANLATFGFFPRRNLLGKGVPNTNEGRVEKCQESFGNCFYYTLQGFFSGSDATNDPYDIMFGVVVVIVLLNVVIAIVSDAWANSQEKATAYFWRGRLCFLSETRLLKNFSRNGSFAQPLLNIVDESRTIFRRGEHVRWVRQHPYNLVETKHQYENPHFYFGPEIANKIADARSFAADLRWIKLEKQSRGDVTFFHRWELHPARVFLRWLGYTIVHICWLVLGIPTFGILWPESFRVWILSYGNSAGETCKATCD